VVNCKKTTSLLMGLHKARPGLKGGACNTNEESAQDKMQSSQL